MKAHKVLVPLDGSALAEAALPKATEIAKQSPATEIVLLRAAEVSMLAGRDPIEAQVAVVHDAEAYLEAVAAALRADGVANVTTSVWYGPPAPAIIEAADAARADLIVMSTHGRSGLGRFFLGSVAESVLRATNTPILLLRSSGAPAEPLTSGTEVSHDKEAAHV